MLKTSEKESITFEEYAKNLNPFFWFRRKVSEGTKGPIEYEFTKRLIVLTRDGLPEESVWLIIRRTVGDNPIYSYYISNAMVSTRMKVFAWLSGIRWAIGQCFEEAKTELGMDHYEVRKWPGWIHHMMTCMLAHFFSGISRSDWGKKTPAVTVSQLRLLLKVVLPLKQFSPRGALELIKGIQLRNHRAYISHRKRKLLMLNNN